MTLSRAGGLTIHGAAHVIKCLTTGCGEVYRGHGDDLYICIMPKAHEGDHGQMWSEHDVAAERGDER